MPCPAREHPRPCAAALLAVVFAGCGGDEPPLAGTSGDDSSSAAATTTATATSSSAGDTDGNTTESGAATSSTGDDCGAPDDPLNCGSCNHDCMGGACTDGQCQPVQVLDGLRDPQHFIADGDQIYIVEHGSSTADPPFSDGVVSRATFAGEAYEIVFASPIPSDPPTTFAGPRAIAGYFAGVDLLALVTDSGHVIGIPYPIGSGDAFVAASNQLRPWRTHVNENGYVYWTNRGSGVAPDGGYYISMLCAGCGDGLPAAGEVNSMAIVGRYHHTEAGAHGQSNGVVWDDGEVVAQGVAYPSDLVLNGYVRAWTAEDEGAVYGHEPFEDQHVLASGLDAPYALAAASGSVFVADRDGGGRLSRCSVYETDRVTTIASGLAAPSFLFVREGDALYWLTRGTQTGTDVAGEPLYDDADGGLWRLVVD